MSNNKAPAANPTRRPASEPILDSAMKAIQDKEKVLDKELNDQMKYLKELEKEEEQRKHEHDDEAKEDAELEDKIAKLKQRAAKAKMQ